MCLNTYVQTLLVVIQKFSTSTTGRNPKIGSLEAFFDGVCEGVLIKVVMVNFPTGLLDLLAQLIIRYMYA